MFNSFDDAKRILVGHQSAVIDRPTLYTFHGVISSTKGFTIGTSPWDESTRNRRKAAGAMLSRPALRDYLDMFDLETFSFIADTFADSVGGAQEISVRPYIQRLALNTTLTLCYGIRTDHVDDDLLREVLEVGSAISLLRSASENYQDYVSVLRYLPRNAKVNRSNDLRRRRDRYLDDLLRKTRENIDKGTDKPCVAARAISGKDTQLSGAEVSSICLSLVSGGFETVPATLTSCLGSLSTDEGQVFQDRAYEDIKRYYPTTEQAWLGSFAEEKVPYVNALVKEAARYYTASAMNLPRKTTRPIDWDGAVIPAKTMVLVNLQAANHDVDHFGSDADAFNPERWLENLGPQTRPGERPLQGLAHFSFGAGARACSGQLVALRLMYAALVRVITSYRIVASRDEPPNTDYVDYNRSKTALVAIPRDYKVNLIPRNGADLEACLQASEKRTANCYVD